jgi:hypothetical protein
MDKSRLNRLGCRNDHLCGVIWSCIYFIIDQCVTFVGALFSSGENQTLGTHRLGLESPFPNVLPAYKIQIRRNA